MSMVADVDIVVIGGGISGLTCGYYLQKFSEKTLKVLILEAKERVGGRLYSTKIPAANGDDEWDLGGQWVSRKQTNVMKLLEDLNVETYPQYIVGEKKLMVNDLSDIRSYSGLIPKFRVLELLELDQLLRKIDKMSQKIPVDNPLSCEFAREWDEQTVDTYLMKTCHLSVTFTIVDVQLSFIVSVSRDIIGLAMRSVFGVEPSQMSFFYFLYYCALAGGFTMLVDSRDGAAQQLRVKGTVAKVTAKLQQIIGRDNVICGDPVVSLDQTEESSVTLKTEQGRIYRAKHVVCAVPPRWVNQIRFQPDLPLSRRQLGSRMPSGNMIKFIVTYKTSFWKSNGASGESTLCSDKQSVGPICATYDATTSNGSPALVGFIAGEHTYYWSFRTKDERQEAVIECLVGMFGPEARSSLIHYEDKDWSLEPFIGGCPVSVMQPGCMIYFHHALREPFGRIHWAGTETGQRWTGYIDGAIEAGERAANEVLASLRSPQSCVIKKPSPSPLFPSNSTHLAVAKQKSVFSQIARFLIVGSVVGGIMAWWAFKMM